MNNLSSWFLENLFSLSELPWLFMALLTFPLLILAKLRKIYPTARLAILLAIPALLTLVLAFNSGLWLLIVAADAVVVVVGAVDLLMLPTAARLSAERKMSKIASLKKPHDIDLAISNRSGRSISLEIRDDRPEHIELSEAKFSRTLQPRSRTTLRYHLLASRRGAYLLEFVYLRIYSALGLWRRHVRLSVASDLHVYPDLVQLREYAMFARTNRLALLGVRRTRKIGQDNEFERLRDYTLDDNYKHIDWRSTARRNKLTVKDFQSNQSQRIIFMLDCGRMMTNESDGLSLLDHSLNALLMLSYVALQQGDSVGLVCFSDRVHSYVPPRSGMDQMNRLLHASFDRSPELVESRYDQAFLYLAARCQKRSLVVLMSNVIDEVNANQVEQYLVSLVGRHLPLGVLMREKALFEAADVSPGTHSEAKLFQGAAAAEILNWRRQVLRDLEHRGVLAIDAFPENLAAPLINSYLEIKARHLL